MSAFYRSAPSARQAGSGTKASSAVLRISELLKESVAKLQASDSPRLDTEILICHALGKNRAWMYAHRDALLDSDQVFACRSMIARRAAGEPVAYITGAREFWSLPIDVNPDVLIPRPESELLVELALQELPCDKTCRVLDAGTGSGCLALAIAGMRPHASITATDNSSKALDVARSNARKLALNNITFRCTNWFDGLNSEHFDLIVCNPPYVASDDIHLSEGDVRFEPLEALQSGLDGLNDIRHIICHARPILKPHGSLILEHGFDQQARITQLLSDARYSAIRGYEDLHGLDRAISAKADG